MQTTDLNMLKINVLTKEQYQNASEAGILDENALYMTPEEVGTTTDLSEYVKKINGVIDNSLIIKNQNSEDSKGIKFQAIESRGVSPNKLVIGNSDPDGFNNIIDLQQTSIHLGSFHTSSDSSSPITISASDANFNISTSMKNPENAEEPNTQNSSIVFSNYDGLTLSNNNSYKGININYDGPSVTAINNNLPLAVPLIRNITISTAEPTTSDGNNGDVWITYTE